MWLSSGLVASLSLPLSAPLWEPCVSAVLVAFCLCLGVFCGLGSLFLVGRLQTAWCQSASAEGTVTVLQHRLRAQERRDVAASGSFRARPPFGGHLSKGLRWSPINSQQRSHWGSFRAAWIGEDSRRHTAQVDPLRLQGAQTTPKGVLQVSVSHWRVEGPVWWWYRVRVSLGRCLPCGQGCSAALIMLGLE